MKYLFKLAGRNIIKQKDISFFNFIGLSIALVTILLLSTWIHFELSYDTFHSKHERIFRFTVDQSLNGTMGKHYARTWQEYKENIQSFFPEIENQTFIRPLEKTRIEIDNKNFIVEKAYLIDSNFAKIFDIEYIYGSSEYNFEPGGDVVISQSLSKKVFGGINPVGKTIAVKTDRLNNETSRKITGVIKDLPRNSHFHIDFFFPYSPAERNSNYSNWAYTYVLLRNTKDVESLNAKQKEFIEQYENEDNGKNINLHFQNISDIHLSSHKDREFEPNGDKQKIRIAGFTLIALLLISLLNYINLNTGLFQKRLKQVAINQIYGSNYIMSTKVMLIETLVFNTIIASISIPIFLLLAQSIDNSQLIVFPLLKDISGILVVGITVLFIVTTSILGSLPAMLHRYNITDILSGHRNKVVISILNKSLMAVQFIISISLIASSILMLKQNKFLEGKSFLSENEAIFFTEIESQIIGDKLKTFENELSQIPEILDYCYLMEPPTDEFNDAFPLKLPVEKKDERIFVCPINETFAGFYNIDIIAGKNLPKYIEEEKKDHFLLNESAVKWFGFNSPEEAVGQIIEFNFFYEGIMNKGEIVGVLKDFHIQTLHKPIKPIVFFTKPIWYHTLHLKAKPELKQIAVQKVKDAWDKTFPDIPFNYTYLDDLYKKAYKKEKLYSLLIQFFAIVGIVISCIGLLGSIKLTIDNKIKEIGIRKANGAQSRELLFMFNKEFLIWICISFIIACPVSYLFMKDWLENFAYSTNIEWWIFAAAGVIASLMAIITISWQTWQAAKSNPVEALRYE